MEVKKMQTNNKKLAEKIEKIKNRTIFGRGTPIPEPIAEVVKEDAEQSGIGQINGRKGKRTKQAVDESIQKESRRDESDVSETLREV